MKKATAAALILSFLWTPLGVPPALAMNDEQREVLVEHLGKFKDLNTLTSKPVGELLGDPHFKKFFEKYAQFLTAIKLADRIASAKDRDALMIVGEEASKALLKKILPNVATSISWFTWAKKGMELFKDFVFDPWLFRQQVETYIARRSEGSDPDDAFATLFGWGHIREKALKTMKKQGYNMELLWVDGEKGKLSEVWEKKLRSFVNALFELQYQKRLLKEAAQKAKQQVPELDQEFRELLATRAKKEGSAPPKETTRGGKREEGETEKAEGRRLFLESAEVTPREGKTGETFHLKIIYGVEGILPDEKLPAKTKLVVSGKKSLPFSEKREELDGGKAKKGVAKATIEANAAFSLPGPHRWDYTIQIPGFATLKGSVPFSVGGRQRKISLVSAAVTPKTGTAGEAFQIKLSYALQGIAPDEKVSEESTMTITGPQSAFFKPYSVLIDGGQLSAGVADLEITASASPSLAGKYLWNYAVSAPGFPPLKGSLPFSVLAQQGAPPPTSKPEGGGECAALAGARGGVPAICISCPASVPWNWGETNNPIPITYRDSGGDIQTLTVNSTVHYQGENHPGTFTDSVWREMKGTSGTYRWPGIVDMFASPATLDFELFVTDKAGNRSNTERCSMNISR